MKVLSQGELDWPFFQELGAGLGGHGGSLMERTDTERGVRLGVGVELWRENLGLRSGSGVSWLCDLEEGRDFLKPVPLSVSTSFRG